MPGSDPNRARLLIARNVYLEKTGNYRAHRTPPRSPPRVQRGELDQPACCSYSLAKDRGSGASPRSRRQGGEQRASGLAPQVRTQRRIVRCY